MHDDWFAVQTQSRREQVAARLLTQKGYECFLPTHAQRSGDNHRHCEKRTPLFPGYLFCRMTAEATPKLVTTPAVVGIVSFAGKTGLVSKKEIADLRLIVDSGFPPESVPYLLPGTPVRIKQGPLAGVAGVVDVSLRKSRFVVSISLLQRSVAVVLDADVLAAMIAGPVLPAATFTSGRVNKESDTELLSPARDAFPEAVPVTS
jgi:transcription termination/antitermination protein NusG